MVKQSKRFRKYAHKHLGKEITKRHETKVVRKSMRERDDYKKKRDVQKIQASAAAQTPAAIARRVSEQKALEEVKYAMFESTMPELFAYDDDDELVFADEDESEVAARRAQAKQNGGNTDGGAGGEAEAKEALLKVIEAARDVNEKTEQTVIEACKKVLDVWQVDPIGGFTHALNALQEAAATLRAAMVSTTRHTCAPIVAWPFFTALQTIAWGIIRQPDEQRLRRLTLPFYSVAIGAVELLPSPQCFPFHLHLIGLVNAVSSATGLYLPTLPHLIRMLDNPDWMKTREGEGGKKKQITVLPLRLVLRLTTAEYKSPAYREALLRGIVFRIVDSLQRMAHRIAFPEVAHPLTQVLQRLDELSKKSVDEIEEGQQKSTFFVRRIRDLKQQVQSQVDLIKKRRHDVPFGPNDVDKVKLWEVEQSQGNNPLVRHWKSLETREKSSNLGIHLWCEESAGAKA